MRAKETKWSKFEKDERTYGTAVLTRLKRRRWAAAIFSGGAIVFWLGEKMGEVEGCQPRLTESNPSKVHNCSVKHVHRKTLGLPLSHAET